MPPDLFPETRTMLPLDPGAVVLGGNHRLAVRHRIAILCSGQRLTLGVFCHDAR